MDQSQFCLLKSHLLNGQNTNGYVHDFLVMRRRGLQLVWVLYLGVGLLYLGGGVACNLVVWLVWVLYLGGGSPVLGRGCGLQCPHTCGSIPPPAGFARLNLWTGATSVPTTSMSVMLSTEQDWDHGDLSLLDTPMEMCRYILDSASTIKRMASIL